LGNSIVLGLYQGTREIFVVMSDKVKNYEKLYREYENLYWKELEENIKLNEEIEQLKWKTHILERKIKSLGNMGKYEKI
jgi:cell shape-determining protein MreC